MIKKINKIVHKFILKKLCQNRVKTETLGSSYGAWTVCPQLINKNSKVLSFGVGQDISFDLALINKFHCQIHAFDPTPTVATWLKNHQTPAKFHFYPFGLGQHDHIKKFYPPDKKDHISHSVVKRGSAKKAIDFRLKSYDSIIKQLGIKKVDLLKMDIEGSEYETIPQIIQSDSRPDQLLVEFHHFFPEFNFFKTLKLVIMLSKHGYKLFSVSQRGYELSFIQQELIND